MASKKKKRSPTGQGRKGKSRPRRPELIPLSEIERREAEQLVGPELTAGDVDADWVRAASVGEEAPGGSVATPDQDRVDEIGKALGVPRAPDEAFRPSAEILESRDRNRWDDEDTPGR